METEEAAFAKYSPVPLLGKNKRAGGRERSESHTRQKFFIAFSHSAEQ